MHRLETSVLLSLILAGGASAAPSTWYVDASAPPGGSGGPGDPFDTITVCLVQPTTVSGDLILVAPGTYHEQVDLLGKEVELRSMSGPSVTVIDGGGMGSTLMAYSGEGPLTIVNGFELTGGTGQPGLGVSHAGGGVFLASSALTLKNCVLQGNQAVLGGAIAAWKGKLRVLSSTIANNHAIKGTPADADDGDGGAIYAKGSKVIITGSVFTSNVAGEPTVLTPARGGALLIDGSTLQLTGSVFGQNYATCNQVTGQALGGALFATGGAVVRIEKTLFQGNFTLADQSRGGALYLDQVNSTVRFSTFDGNTAGDFLHVMDSEGGALYASDLAQSFVETTWFQNNQAQFAGGAVYGVGTFRDCELWYNQSKDGGAAYSSPNGGMSFDDSRFLGNQTSWVGAGEENGGAVYGPALLHDCGLLANVAHGKGGGAFGAYLDTCTVDGNSTLTAGSAASIRGGGLHDCWATDCVISNNSALGDPSLGVQSLGGGACSSVLVRCEVWNNTADLGGGLANSIVDRGSINANTATMAGGGAWFGLVPTGPDTMINSIVWNNAPDEVVDGGGTPAITYTDVMGGWPGLGNASSDPMWFDELNHDYYLELGSPCIDAGDPSMSDPDGSVVDMGAHPYDPLH